MIWHVPIPLNESHVPIPLNKIHAKTRIGSKHENPIVAVTTFGSPLAISKNQIISCWEPKYCPNVKIYQLLWPLLEACGQPLNAKDRTGNENMLQTWKSNVWSDYFWKANSESIKWRSGGWALEQAETDQNHCARAIFKELCHFWKLSQAKICINSPHT